MAEADDFARTLIDITLETKKSDRRLQDDPKSVVCSFNIEGGKGGAAGRGKALVFFRTKGGALGCVSALCAHRGASLKKGCVSDGKIRCPFHGIEYDVSGKCVHIPSEGRAAVQNFDRFHLKHYETREIGGIIFVWYGDRTPDHEPDVFPICQFAQQIVHLDSNYSLKITWMCRIWRLSILIP